MIVELGYNCVMKLSQILNLESGKTVYYGLRLWLVCSGPREL